MTRDEVADAGASGLGEDHSVAVASRDNYPRLRTTISNLATKCFGTSGLSKTWKSVSPNGEVTGKGRERKEKRTTSVGTTEQRLTIIRSLCSERNKPTGYDRVKIHRRECRSGAWTRTELNRQRIKQ